MREWRFGDVVDNFDSLRVPIASAKRVAGPYPYYGASGIVDHVEGYLFDGDYLLISEDGENLRARSTPIAFMASGRFWVNNHAHVTRGREGVADSRYLCYRFKVTDIGGALNGSVQPKLSQAALHDVRMTLPPLPEQQAIAEVLGALDDKIAANAKLVFTAESLMVALTEHLPIGDVTVTDIATLSKDQLSASAMVGRQMAHYSLPAFDDGKMPTIEPGSHIKSHKFRVTGASVLLSKLNPRFPRVWNVLNPGDDAVASTEFLVLEPRTGSSSVLWTLLANARTMAYLGERVAGTSGSHQRVRPDQVMGMPVADPGDLGQVRTGLIDQLGAQVHILQRQSQTLAALRDTLLPPLMDGTLRVKDAIRRAEDVL